MKNLLLFLALFSLTLYSCEQKAPIAGAITESQSTTAITTELGKLEDSMSALLTEINKLDTSKLNLQKRLLLEISYGRGATTQADYMAANELVKNLSDYPGMEVLIKAQSMLVAFDSDSDSLISTMDRMLSVLKKAEHIKPIMTELDNGIKEKDNKAVALRFNYDELAKRYNIILEKNQENLMKADSNKYGKSIPLFQLEVPS
jgi:hypothetical protein